MRRKNPAQASGLMSGRCARSALAQLWAFDSQLDIEALEAK